LKGGIIVRPANEGEEFLALDGRTYELNPRNLVIADQERAVGIGGVMGGEETGVMAETKSVLLEAAYFQPASIRRTARELSLPSDASYRFERGVDPQMILRASARAAQLMADIAGGKPAGEIAIGGELPADPKPVTLSYEQCNSLTGVEIPPKTADEILTGSRAMASPC
jgi:phenylalanyl-tRNA synthetase beta chain